MTLRSLRLRRIRATFAVTAMLVASLASFSVGSNRAYAAGSFEIQNQQTGLCIQASQDLNPEYLTAQPCGTSGDQYFAVSTLLGNNQLADVGGGATAPTCLATDSQSDGLSVDCGNSNYATSWEYASLSGAWTTIWNANGCYLKMLSDNSVVCMTGFQGSNAQWRMIYS